MKIVDLMYNIINGELVPKIIQYNEIMYHYDQTVEDYKNIDTGICLFDDISAKELNEEIAIINNGYIEAVKGK